MEGEREREREPFDRAAAGKVSCDTNFHLGPVAGARFANAATPSIHPSIVLPRRPERQFSTVKGREVMKPGHFLAETRQGLSRLAPWYSAAGTLRLHVTANSGTLILPDPNCRPGYVSPLLQRERERERQRQSSRKNLCHSESLHVRVPNSTYLESCVAKLPHITVQQIQSASF